MDVLGHEEFVCPNGHSFIGVRAVRCEECEAPVACVPLAVEIALREQLEGAVAENEQLRADLTRVRGQRDALIEHEHVMTAEIDRLRAGG